MALGAAPIPQPTRTERVAVLTLSQALAAQHGEEEDGTDHPGCLRHAGLREDCSVVLGQSCCLLGSGPLGCFYGGAAGLASPRASSCVGRERT